MDKVGSKESEEYIGFDELVAELSQKLNITPEALTRAFDLSQITIKKRTKSTVSRGKFFRTEQWKLLEESDEDGYYEIMNNIGVIYKIGLTTFKQYDKETQQMVDMTAPIVIDKPFRYTKGGSAPDSFENFPYPGGSHPADN